MNLTNGPLVETHWDCECDSHYIHSTKESSCPICLASQDDSPPAREQELLDPNNIFVP